MSAATFPRSFVPLAELSGVDIELGPLETAEFIERQHQVLDARRAEGMNLIVQGDDGRILKIAPDGTETDVTEEATRRVEEARRRLGWND